MDFSGFVGGNSLPSQRRPVRPGKPASHAISKFRRDLDPEVA